MTTVQADRDALFFPDNLEPGQHVHVLSVVGNDALVDWPGTVRDPKLVDLNQLRPLPDDGDIPAPDSLLPSEGRSTGALPVEGLGMRGDFGEGQRVTYTPAVPPIRSLPATVTTVHDNGRLTILIDDTEDIPSEYRGGTRTVRASRCAPLTAAVEIPAHFRDDAAIDSAGINLPAEPAPDFDEWMPRFVDPDHAAITGFCRDCESQYDYIVDPLDLNPRDVDLVYWAAFSQPCPVCRLIRAAQVVTSEPAVDITNEILALSQDDPTEPLLSISDVLTYTEEIEYSDDVVNEALQRVINTATPPDWFEPPLETPADPFNLTSLTEPVSNAALITDLRALVDHWQRAAELESTRADRLQEKVDDYMIQHIELLKRIPVAPGACLDNADLDHLDFLTTKHLDRGLHDAVRLLGFVNFDDFTNHYHSFSEAMKGIYQRILDGGLPVVIHEGFTDISSNDKLYFSVSFGFGNVAFWNGDLEQFINQTGYRYILDSWRKPGYTVEFFNPPLRAILGRDGKRYPKIKTLLED